MVHAHLATADTLAVNTVLAPVSFATSPPSFAGVFLLSQAAPDDKPEKLRADNLVSASPSLAAPPIFQNHLLAAIGVETQSPETIHPPIANLYQRSKAMTRDFYGQTVNAQIVGGHYTPPLGSN
jgi:hypothetical protein